MHYYDELLQTDFASFIEKSLATTNPGAEFLPNWHIDLIAEYLEAARVGKITRLIINMPPRALKSQCVSVAWPAWILGHNPSARIIAASYSAGLSVKHSLDCRQIIASLWYQRLFPKTKLTRDQNEKHKFMTTKRGFRFATSVGGTLTGEGGNFLIIDDPMNAAQAMNAHWREQVKRWYDQTFSTRLDDKKNGAIVLVMQRLHMDDLTAHLLSKGGFMQLSLPAIAEEDCVFDFGKVKKERLRGEPLHAAREDAQLIERAKRELGSQGYAAQYQQQPIPEEGALLKLHWFKRHKSPPEEPERTVQSWDTAIKSGSQHDASVCLTFMEKNKVSYLVDVQLLRLEYPDLKKALLNAALRWKPNAIVIEDKASGQQLLQDLKRETHLPIIGSQSKANKITRFAAVSALIEAGRVSLPHNATWLSAFEQELMAFPAGANDDQVDALTQYLDFLRKNSFNTMRIRGV